MRSHRYLVSIYALLLILTQGLSPLHGIDHLLITDNVIKMFEQHKTGGLEIATAGYTLLNVGLSNKLTLGNYGANLFIRATNLLDKDVRRHNSFLNDRPPLPGRSITVGVSAEF